MQNDPWLKARIEQLMVQSITDLVGEPFHLTVSAIDLLRGKIVLENISISSSKGEWAFQCPEMHINLSLFSWFKGKGFDTSLIFHRPTVFTQYEKGFALDKPFYALVYAPIVLPVNLVHCAADNAAITIASEAGELSVRCTSMTSIDSHAVATKVICSDGQVLKDSSHPRHALFAHQLSGTINIDIPLTNDSYEVVLNLSCLRPVGVAVPYQFYYRYKNNTGKITWRAEDGSCSVQADTTHSATSTQANIKVAGVLGELASLVADDERVRLALGTGSFDGDVEITDTGYSYKGVSVVKDASYKGVKIAEAVGLVSGNEKGLDVTINKINSSGIVLQGKLTAQFTRGVSAVFSLLQPYTEIPQSVVDKGRVEIEYNGKILKADVKARGTLPGGVIAPFKASITTDFTTATLKGSLAGNPLQITGDVSPVKLRGVSLQDPLHMTRLELKETEGLLQGVIDSVLIKKVLVAVTGYQLSGDAQVHIKTYETDEGTRVELNVHDASLKIPGTYTVIKEVSGILDIVSSDKCVVIRDLLVIFHKGSTWSSCASFYFNDDGSLKGAHVPLQCKGLLISKQKELFGTLSGGVTLSYDGKWLCKGLMTIENAHLRSNLLSSKVQRELMHASSVGGSFSQNCMLDIQLQSRTPIKVETSFFTADAHLDVLLKGSAAQPEVKGTIELLNGSFAFPYKPLFLTNGTITLSPTQLDGPVINLTAKNKVRSYSIAMIVTGSLHQPNVTFESTPQLSEEGIVTLLFAGADHGSLTAAMPRLLMEQIDEVLFGSDESLSRAQQILKSLLAPLKNVRLVQKDDTKEELQAVLEVDINDRLRAKAQNNIHLTDETQLELEYVVSDDVTVKAVRDQAGSLGGEVEMRWKF